LGRNNVDAVIGLYKRTDTDVGVIDRRSNFRVYCFGIIIFFQIGLNSVRLPICQCDRDIDLAGSWSEARSGRTQRLLVILTIQRGRAHFLDTNADDFVSSGANLEAGNTKVAVQQFSATESRGVADTVQLLLQLTNFRVQSGPLRIAVGAVGGLKGKVTHTLQDVGGLLQSAFSCLSQRNTVVCVAHSDAQAVDLAGQAVSDLQASCVVFGTIDTATGG